MTRFLKYIDSENELKQVHKEIGSLIERDLSIDELNALFLPKPSPEVEKDKLTNLALDTDNPDEVEIPSELNDLQDAPKDQIQAKRDPSLGNDTVVLGVNGPTKFVFKKISEDTEEVEEEILAPLEDMPTGDLALHLEDEAIKDEGSCTSGAAVIPSYNFVPEFSPEELAAIVASKLPNSKVIIAQNLQDGPHGEVSAVSMTPHTPAPAVVLPPEEDPDGLSVAGMDNQLGLNFLM